MNRLRSLGLVVAAAALCGLGAAPAAAAQQPECPVPNPSYTGPCGPTFTLPAWTDTGGWTDPSQYSTIQLADVDGDGRDELLGRGDSGLQVHEFDTTVGEWRPQLTANGLPAVLTDFRTSLQSEAPVWTLPQYYLTIQAADIDGQAGEEVLARFPDGLRVYKYTPAAGGGPGTWAAIGRRGPFADSGGWADDPSLYSTIQTGNLVGGAAKEVFARTASGIVAYRWNGSGWTALPDLTALGTNAEGGSQPAYYADLLAADADPSAGTADEVLSRTPEGVFTAALQNNRWGVLERLPSGAFSVFEDDRNVLSVDCPFTGETQDCFGSSPSYYETMQAADVDGEPGAELLGRAIDGLRVHKWGGPTTGWLRSLPTLTDLAGPASTPAWQYATIQTANLDGAGGSEVLALEADGLQAWSYDASTSAWAKVATPVPLALTGGDWHGDPSTFATIQTGDVDGDGRDEVIARGRYGIRTWFFRKGAWERYRPYGYAPFPTTGQQNAYNELNEVAHSANVIGAATPTLRDVYTGEDPSQQLDLSNIVSHLPGAASCTDGSSGVPTQYGSCTPPPGSSGFSASDWTAVVNQILREVYWAQEVLAHFAELKELRSSLYLDGSSELPAISGDLQLQAAADQRVNFELIDTIGTVLEIIGTIAAVAFPEDPAAAALLAVTGEVLGSATAGSSTIDDSFNATYSDLQSKFAQAASEVGTTIDAHSQWVRQDEGLLRLVGELRAQGTWGMDAIGAASAGRQGFSLWAYQTLLPALYARYHIFSCVNRFLSKCSGPSAGPGVIGGGANFTAFGVPPAYGSLGSTPCTVDRYNQYTCQFQVMGTELRQIIWGRMSPNCAYQPGNAATAWNFGCALGVLESHSVAVGSPGWDLPTYTGTPVVTCNHCWNAVRGSVRRVGTRRAAMRLVGGTVLPRAVDLRRARVSVQRVLHEPRGLGELLRPRRATPIVFERVGRGRRGAVRLRGRGARRGARPRLLLRKRARGRLLLSLRMPRERVPLAPGACNALPASLRDAPRSAVLHTRIRIDDGRGRPLTLTLRPTWRCHRDRSGTIRRLSVVQPKAPKQRAGLVLRLRGPRSVRAGATASFSVTVRNRRPSRRGSSLWNAALVATPDSASRLAGRPRGAAVRNGSVLWRAGELRAGGARTLTIRVRAPRSPRHVRVCLQGVATADAARPAAARRCVRIRR